MDLESILDFVPVLIAIAGLVVTFSGNGKKKKQAEAEQSAQPSWESRESSKEIVYRETAAKQQPSSAQKASSVRNKMAAERAREALSKSGKARQDSTSGAHSPHRTGSGRDTCEGAALAGALRRTQNLSGLQSLSGNQLSAGSAVASMIKEEVSPEKLREAVVWSEILGQPMCRKRHQKAAHR